MTSKAPRGKAETKKALIVVRTYPTPAEHGVEVSCTAAITDDNQWLRLFPVPWRYLDSDKQFRKYQWVEVSVIKARDGRPESYKLTDPSGIKILSEPLSSKYGWRDRKAIVLPLEAQSLCDLVRQRNKRGFPTLGVFRPKSIDRLTIKAESGKWTARQQMIIKQQHLFDKRPLKELEKVPFSFRYQFRCNDNKCRGHKLICTDWEMGESYRKWRRDYGDKWEEKFRQRYETDMIQKNDTHFYVGTVHGHPHTWIICGLFYPPLNPRGSRKRSELVPSLFDALAIPS